jgi:hypothetical protein
MKETRTMNMLDPFGKGFLPGQAHRRESFQESEAIRSEVIQRARDGGPVIRLHYQPSFGRDDSKPGYMSRS